MKLEVNAHRLVLVHLRPHRSRPSLETWECERCGTRCYWRQGVLQGYDDEAEKRYREEGLTQIPPCPATGARAVPAAIGTGWELIEAGFLP